VGVVDALKSALVRARKDIVLAFVYGSYAKGEEIGSSDVDLMVVGNQGLSGLSSRLRRVEHALGREVNPMVYSEKEFVDKVSNKNHFITTVLSEPKLFIVGDDAKLFEITGGKQTKTA
jgi:predicted nucleotidyltransferase